jgi:hypothetical protein
MRLPAYSGTLRPMKVLLPNRPMLRRREVPPHEPNPLSAGRDRMLRSSLRLDSGGQRVASWTATRRPSQKRFMASMRVKILEVTPLSMNLATGAGTARPPYGDRLSPSLARKSHTHTRSTSKLSRREISGLKQDRVFCRKSQTIHGPKGNGHGTTDGFAATLPLAVSAVLPVARIRLGTAWRAWVDGQRHAADLKECEICGLG